MKTAVCGCNTKKTIVNVVSDMLSGTISNFATNCQKGTILVKRCSCMTRDDRSGKTVVSFCISTL